MSLILSTKATAARTAAARIPALQACLDLLQNSILNVYDGIKPATPESTPDGNLLASIQFSTFGTIDTANYWIDLIVPVEGVVLLSGTATYGIILDGDGDPFCDVVVTATGGGGEIQLASAALTQGAFIQIVSGRITG